MSANFYLRRDLYLELRRRYGGDTFPHINAALTAFFETDDFLDRLKAHQHDENSTGTLMIHTGFSAHIQSCIRQACFALDGIPSQYVYDVAVAKHLGIDLALSTSPAPTAALPAPEATAPAKSPLSAHDILRQRAARAPRLKL